MRVLTTIDHRQQLANKKSKNHVSNLASSIVSIMHKNMIVDPADLTKKRVKKDMLWKPLFRCFRQFFRMRMSTYIDIKLIMDNNSFNGLEKKLGE